MVNARDTQELIWRDELVRAIHKLRDVPGAFEAVQQFEAALSDFDHGRWNWHTINAVMKAHRVMNGVEG